MYNIYIVKNYYTENIINIYYEINFINFIVLKNFFYHGNKKKLRTVSAANSIKISTTSQLKYNSQEFLILNYL